VNCQEQTREELLETLRIALAEALELSRCEAGDSAGSGRAAGIPGGTNPTVTALGAPPV